ncbi:MAG: hypothetical protein QOE92_1353, partial [Chloroflexota bacterium]|nr:hypothetical protein [Chloroflexota bacterium]
MDGTRLILTVVAAVAGLGAGYVTHVLNQRLAASEEEATEPALPREALWAPVLDAALLAALVFRFGLGPRTLVGVPLVLVLVQVIVFDARHRLILNRVIYPAIVVALLVAPVNPLLDSAGDGWLAHVMSSIEGAALAGGLFFV